MYNTIIIIFLSILTATKNWVNKYIIVVCIIVYLGTVISVVYENIQISM